MLLFQKTIFIQIAIRKFLIKKTKFFFVNDKQINHLKILSKTMFIWSLLITTDLILCKYPYERHDSICFPPSYE